MIILKIIGIILLCVALVIGVVLLMPIDLLLKADNKNGFSVRLRFLGKIFGKQSSPKTDNPFTSKIKSALGLSNIQSTDAFKKSIKDQSVFSTLKETLNNLIVLIDKIFWLLRRCSIARCKIKYISGGENAAIEYGRACAVIYPLVGYLQSQKKLKGRNLRLDIYCDYSISNSVYDIDISARAKLFYIVIALWKVAKNNAEAIIDEKYSKKHQKGKA